MMNRNVHPALCGNVRAALPTRATRVIMNGNHTAFSTPATLDHLWPVSHKV